MKILKNVTMARFFFSVGLLAMLFSAIGCDGGEEERRRISRAERDRLRREDSLALKVGTLPTLDCLPLFVAQESGLLRLDSLEIRLKPYDSQIDAEADMKAGKIEGCATDLVRTERLIRRGTPMTYFTATNTYWQLVTNRKARIANLKQLGEKMVAMTRFSATDMLASMAVDSVRLKDEEVFRVQINDPNIRLLMLQNNEMDAMLLPEPQATTARLYKNPVLMDSRDKDLRLGAIAFRTKAIADKRRARQVELLREAWNKAADSIRTHGLQHYAPLIMKYTKADDRTVKALPAISFGHAEQPRPKDIERAAKWLK